MDEREQARRAVEMAREMQRRMLFLRSKWFDHDGIEAPFEIRIGINTGPAHIGNFGSADRMDYTVIGHHVNIAARLESSCTPGEILISQATYTLVKDFIPCEDRGEVLAKGISEPVKVYEVVTT
jgi:class 3 adenylate cyclase